MIIHHRTFAAQVLMLGEKKTDIGTRAACFAKMLHSSGN